MWGEFCGKGFDNLVEILGKMNRAMDKDILWDHLLSYWRKHCCRKCLFPRSINPKNICNIVKQWLLRTHTQKLLLKWLILTPDMNPLEDHWASLTNVYGIISIPIQKNFQKPFKNSENKQINKKTCHNNLKLFIESMPCICAVIFIAKGMAIKY